MDVSLDSMKLKKHALFRGKWPAFPHIASGGIPNVIVWGSKA